MAKSVKVVFLGGVGEIGKNMTALEFGDDIIIVDCGVEFPREDSPGIDAIIPDITYIRDNLKKLRGIVLTHGHEDHIGALPYYADELKVPVYGTALTLGLLERKLSERGIKAQLNRVKPGDEVEMGCFKVEFIKVAHSMAGACALSVTTPVGIVFVTGDFKIDNTPIPGNEKSIYDVINNLFRKGANVIYEAMNEVHVSGHAYEEELKIMLSLVRPKYFMPVHGEYRHQFKHAEIAKDLGIKESNIVIPNIGEAYGVNAHSIKQHSNVPAGNVYVDGVVLEDGSSVVSDRRSLAEYGMLLVLASVNTEKGVIAGDPDVIARGFNLTDEIEKEIADTVRDTVNAADFDENGLGELARAVKKAVRKLFYRDRQFPIIIPIIVED